MLMRLGECFGSYYLCELHVLGRDGRREGGREGKALRGKGRGVPTEGTLVAGLLPPHSPAIILLFRSQIKWVKKGVLARCSWCIPGFAAVRIREPLMLTYNFLVCVFVCFAWLKHVDLTYFCLRNCSSLALVSCWCLLVIILLNVSFHRSNIFFCTFLFIYGLFSIIIVWCWFMMSFVFSSHLVKWNIP